MLAPPPKNDEAAGSDRGYDAERNHLSCPVNQVCVGSPVEHCPCLPPCLNPRPELGQGHRRCGRCEEEVALTRVSIDMAVRPLADGQPWREEENPR